MAKAQSRAIAPITAIRGELDLMKPELKRVIPAHLPTDKLVRTAISSIQKNPKLLEANRGSLMSAIMDAAVLGLVPDGITGQCYLIPIKGQVQLWLGYKGYLQLLKNTGGLLSIQTQIVYENDLFEFEFGFDERLRHVPLVNGDRGAPIYAWGLANLKDGRQWDVMTLDEVNKTMRGSPSKGNSGPWKDHWDQMARKTMLIRLCKMLPMDVDRQADLALQLEYSQHDGKAGHLKMDEKGVIELKHEASPDVDEPVRDISALDDFAGKEDKTNEEKELEPKTKPAVKPEPEPEPEPEPAKEPEIEDAVIEGEDHARVEQMGTQEDHDPETGEVIEDTPPAAEEEGIDLAGDLNYEVADSAMSVPLPVFNWKLEFIKTMNIPDAELSKEKKKEFVKRNQSIALAVFEKDELNQLFKKAGLVK